MFISKPKPQPKKQSKPQKNKKMHGAKKAVRTYKIIKL